MSKATGSINKKQKVAQSSPEDIVELILHDHTFLKEMAKILKDDNIGYSKKHAIAQKFIPRLLAHTKPEEQVWYSRMKQGGPLVRTALALNTEHDLAGQLCDEVQQTPDSNLFCAKIKVLAEMVENHIKEEEEVVLPRFKRETTLEERVELGLAYLDEQAEFEASTRLDDEEEFSAERSRSNISQNPF